MATHQADLIFNSELSPRKGAKIPFGIHTNCAVKSIEFKAGEFTDLNFEDSEGRFHNKRLWHPNGKYPRDIVQEDGSKRTETAEEALFRDEKEKLAHVIKLLHIFLGRDALKSFPALEYTPFVEYAVKMLMPKLATKKVNLKLIYDAEGIYSVFGTYPDYAEEHIEGQEPTLFYTPWEKENRCTYKGKQESKGTSFSTDDLFGGAVK